MKPPKVSINLCCYNSEKYLRETLDSVVNQTYKNWELVIINDGSSDSTESIVYEYINRGYPIAYHYQENRGLGYSRNEALKRSRGKLVAFIDHDDIWLPEKLEKQLLFFQNPNVGLVYSDALYFNDRGYAKRQFGKHIPPEGMVFNNLLTNYNMTISTVVIRAKSLNSLDHWFDDKLKVIEEKDLFIRIAKDWLFLYAPIVGVKYRMHATSTSIANLHLWPKDYEWLIEKYIKIFPESKELFEDNYRRAITIYDAKIEWMKNNNHSARVKIKKEITKSKKCMMFYIAMFFPYKLFVLFCKIFLNRVFIHY